VTCLLCVVLCALWFCVLLSRVNPPTPSTAQIETVKKQRGVSLELTSQLIALAAGSASSHQPSQQHGFFSHQPLPGFSARGSSPGGGEPARSDTGGGSVPASEHDTGGELSLDEGFTWGAAAGPSLPPALAYAGLPVDYSAADWPRLIARISAELDATIACEIYPRL